MKFPDRKIIGLMACDPKGIIGKNGGLPWSYPEELEHFRRAVRGQIMVMGRKTFESIPPDLLKTTLNIVFSKTYLPSGTDNVIFVRSLSEFLKLDNLPENKQIFMIGGARIAKLFLKEGVISEFLLTKIKKRHDGDVVFPLELLDKWQSVLVEDREDYLVYNFSR